MWYVYTMEYNSAVKKKEEIMPSPATWINLEIIIQSEVGKKKRQMPHDITYTWNLKYSTNKPTNKSTKQKQTLRHREQTCRCQGAGRKWDRPGVWGW